MALHIDFKAFFIERVARNFGRWCYVPVGRQETAVAPSSHVAILNGKFGSGYAPKLTPEVRFMMAEDDGDYCLPYSFMMSAGEPIVRFRNATQGR